MDVNTLYNKRYNFLDLSDLRNALSEDIKEVMDSFRNERGQMVVLNHLPRIGKTYGLLDYLNNTPNINALYVSDIHEQIEQISSYFNKMRIIKGAASICPLLNGDEKSENNDFRYLFSKKFKQNIACMVCSQYKGCIYNKQFNYPDKDIILAVAKESLPNKKIHSSFDFIVFDEDMTKSKVIMPYCPNDMNISDLDSLNYGETILSTYLDLKFVIDEKGVMDWDSLESFKKDANLLASKGSLKVTLDEIKQMDAGEKKKFHDILPFMANMHISYEWLEKCHQVGEFRKNHFRPYIHYAFDLLKKYDSNLIIANATFDNDIFNLLRGQYKTVLPELKSISKFPIENKDSFLFNYNNLGRSCSRSGLKEYGNEIYSIVKSISNFCRNKWLKSGLITFPELEDDFNEYFDVVDHFIGHRGKNDFDDVDVLVILGTYNIDPYGLLTNHYAISGEYLKKEHIQNWKTRTINGCKVSMPKYEPFMKTRMYKLYEEHLQAILRSGAHIRPKKVIVNFGYAPQGVEEIFTYKTFKSKRQLVNGYLTRMFNTKRRKIKKGR